MRLLAKFSLVYVLVFGLGLGAAGFLFSGELQKGAREQVLHEARIIMETALAVRTYTANQVGPAFVDANHREDALLGSFSDLCVKRAAAHAAAARRAAQERAAAIRRGENPPPVRAPDDGFPDPFREACARQERPLRAFRPQTVPAFSAAEMFANLSKRYPEYTYKEASLNPTNPRNRAVDWEEDLLKAFRNRPDLTVVDGERTTPLGRSLFLARPMTAAKACLVCHSVPSAAPPEMLKLYGAANGFGWKEGEIIAAQIVSVPVAVPVAIADRAFRRLLASLAVVASVTLVLLNLVLYLTVIRPVSRLATVADEISMGNLEVPELEVKGTDEISTLGAAFNRMHRSLVAAVKLLDHG